MVKKEIIESYIKLLEDNAEFPFIKSIAGVRKKDIDKYLDLSLFGLEDALEWLDSKEVIYYKQVVHTMILIRLNLYKPSDWLRFEDFNNDEDEFKKFLSACNRRGLKLPRINQQYFLSPRPLI